MFKTQK